MRECGLTNRREILRISFRLDLPVFRPMRDASSKLSGTDFWLGSRRGHGCFEPDETTRRNFLKLFRRAPWLNRK